MPKGELVWYRVYFTIKEGGKQTRYAVDCFAANKQDAIDTASELWYADHKQHMFRFETFRMTKLAKLDNHFLKTFTITK